MQKLIMMLSVVRKVEICGKINKCRTKTKQEKKNGEKKKQHNKGNYFFFPRAFYQDNYRNE